MKTRLFLICVMVSKKEWNVDDEFENFMPQYARNYINIYFLLNEKQKKTR